jgi:phage head maturation protease
VSTLLRELRLDKPGSDLAPDALIPATIATTAPVMRDGYAEVLDCSAEGVDITRAPLPLIVAHDKSRLAIGLVESVVANGDKVTGLVRFSNSPEGQQVRADVLAGIHRSLSVGYRLLDNGRAIDGGFIYRWQPHEVSIVPVPADSGSGFFRSLTESNTMTTKDASQTADEIRTLCTRHNLAPLAQTLITEGRSLEQARAIVLEKLAARDDVSGGHLNVRTAPADGVAERELLINTLVRSMGGKPKGEVISATDCTGLALRALQLAGHSVSHRDSRDSILHRAMGTSDFPTLLGNAAGRVLLGAFEESPPALKQVARLNNLPDFKVRTVIRLPGGAPSLEKVNEHGEFKQGAMTEVGNGWKLATYGRIVSLTRQALVNDDLSAFSGLLAEFGRAAARRESDELAAMLTASPLVDGNPLFHANNSSLITGAPSALQLSSLALAVKSLRLQKEVGGGFIIQEPAFLVVPAALETTARQLVASITPASAGNVQPYSLAIVVEPRLDAASATAWYLVAGNQMALEYGYLDGAQGPQTFQQEGFDSDGMDVKCRLDFGTGWVAPVGWVKSNGA